MKTLDEVIETAPYVGTEWTNDALHYLKVLKDILDPLKVKKITHEITCPQCNSVIAILLPESNEPLTWDELKTMEGKPVWVEHLKDGVVYKAGWCLIVQVDDSLPDIPCVGLVDTDADYRNLEVEWMDMGQWQAYRKERYEPDQKAN